MGFSFREYIRRRRVTDGPVGDFVEDAKTDRGLPDAASWDQLDTYLITRGADSGVRQAGYAVWRSYLAAKRRRMPRGPLR
jgi:hypothetical protein